jgi:hypothetical protein
MLHFLPLTNLLLHIFILNHDVPEQLISAKVQTGMLNEAFGGSIHTYLNNNIYMTEWQASGLCICG